MMIVYRYNTMELSIQNDVFALNTDISVKILSFSVQILKRFKVVSSILVVFCFVLFCFVFVLSLFCFFFFLLFLVCHACNRRFWPIPKNCIVIDIYMSEFDCFSPTNRSGKVFFYIFQFRIFIKVLLRFTNNTVFTFFLNCVWVSFLNAIL